MVRLKDAVPDLVESTISNFNSKMVRLKGRVQNENPRPTRTFQFQNGAIKSYGGMENKKASFLISIPKWCD